MQLDDGLDTRFDRDDHRLTRGEAVEELLGRDRRAVAVRGQRRGVVLPRTREQQPGQGLPPAGAGQRRGVRRTELGRGCGRVPAGECAFAERLGETCRRGTEFARQVAQDARRQVVALGVVPQRGDVDVAACDEQRQVPDDLAGRSDLDGFAKQVVGQGVTLLHL